MCQNTHIPILFQHILQTFIHTFLLHLFLLWVFMASTTSSTTSAFLFHTFFWVFKTAAACSHLVSQVDTLFSPYPEAVCSRSLGSSPGISVLFCSSSSSSTGNCSKDGTAQLSSAHPVDPHQSKCPIFDSVTFQPRLISSFITAEEGRQISPSCLFCIHFPSPSPHFLPRSSFFFLFFNYY